MIDVLVFVALWCQPYHGDSIKKEQACRERLIKCASRSTPLGLIFSQYDTELYWCAYNERIKP